MVYWICAQLEASCPPSFPSGFTLGLYSLDLCSRPLTSRRHLRSEGCSAEMPAANSSALFLLGVLFNLLFQDASFLPFVLW